MALAVGVGSVQLLLAGSHSLKDKRRVVRSIVARLRRRFNVSVAEIGELDNWQAAMLCVTTVSNDAGCAQAVISKAVEWLSEERLDVEIGDISIQVW